MKAAISKAAAFFIIWLILSSSYDRLHIVLGIAVAALIVWLNPVEPASPFRNFPWLRVVGYVPWLFGRILASGFHVSRLILDPSLPIAPALIRYRTKLRDDGEIVFLGNSITLTPGTTTVEIDSNELVVHALDEVSGESISDRRLEQKIHSVFQRR